MQGELVSLSMPYTTPIHIVSCDCILDKQQRLRSSSQIHKTDVTMATSPRAPRESDCFIRYIRSHKVEVKKNIRNQRIGRKKAADFLQRNKLFMQIFCITQSFFNCFLKYAFQFCWYCCFFSYFNT